jgi:integrase
MPMPRPRRDGTPSQAPNRRKLHELLIKRQKPRARAFMIWDTIQAGFALSVQPTGHKAYKVVYSHQGRVRWFHLGNAQAITLSDARRLASRVIFQVAEGKDPQAERKAARSAGTFGDLAARYVDDYARKHNRSWRQADALVRRHLLPGWACLSATAITRTDVKAMMAQIEAPVVANQTLAAASAIFSWAVREEVGGVKVNPCSHVQRNEVRSRERVLSNSEIPLFWTAFDDAGMAGTALKLILLLGQRPGEVSHMRSKHIDSGWWEMPGQPVPELGWPGTKNGQTHRVWLPRPAQSLLAALGGEDEGFVLAGPRGGPIDRLDVVMRAICVRLGIEDRVTPHDLRRTHGTRITALGFGRDAMNRIQNHREGGIGSVYDRHRYSAENQRIMEAVAADITALAEPGFSEHIAFPFDVQARDSIERISLSPHRSSLCRYRNELGVEGGAKKQNGN